MFLNGYGHVHVFDAVVSVFSRAVSLRKFAFPSAVSPTERADVVQIVPRWPCAEGWLPRPPRPLSEPLFPPQPLVTWTRVAAHVVAASASAALMTRRTVSPPGGGRSVTASQAGPHAPGAHSRAANSQIAFENTPLAEFWCSIDKY